ncbi:DUF3987 domain-containing protein [Lacrimispora sp. NSJ-141]|uniref:DUF3987 domain-containing protein n=1 Tax=Lientehia hominis TaxID=2897778 RepID=A0AAP2RL37_9FIRM|nr:YfjI family protein [Lientehia hominis]MCD2492960.1 DUF3987 domain-containing protein [Lientehia hominis]
MNTREFLDILYGKMDDGFIGISYIEKKNVITKWFQALELDSAVAYTDLDIKGSAHAERNLPETKDQIIDFMKNESPMKPSLLIWSGNGIHAMWLFEAPYMIDGNAGYVPKEKTCNTKTAVPSEDEDAFACMGTSSADELISKCRLLQYCQENADTLSEPLWQAMISNVALTADGQEKVHELSSPYPKYTYAETEKKFRLAVLAVCLQGKYRFKAKANWSEPLNRLIGFIMAFSTADFLSDGSMIFKYKYVEAEQNPARAVEIEKSKTRKQILEQRQKALISQAAEGKVDMSEVDKVSEEIANFREAKPLKLYVDDITTEKLTSVLADNDGRAAVLSTEGGIFDTLAGIYTKNVNIDVILKGYSGDSIRVDRIGRQSESVMTPALTMFLMAQLSVLSGLMGDGTFRGRGLTARFLYSIPASKAGCRRYRSVPVPMNVCSNYEKCICNLLEDEYEKDPEMIMLSPEADRMIEAFAEEMEPKLKTEFADISDWAGKLVGNVLRIAGLLCRASVYRCHDFLAVADELIVDAETMQNAIRIGEYFVEHARAAFLLMGVDEIIKQSRYVLDAIKNAGLAEVTRRDVQRLCRRFKRAEELQLVLDNLVGYGYLSVIDDGKYKGKGRPPAMKYAVNPYIYHNK